MTTPDQPVPLQHAWATAVAVPVGLFFVGVLVKKVARGTSWKLEDWCLGPDSAMASLTTASLYLLELASREHVRPEQLVYLCAFLFFNLLLLLFILSVHQEYFADIQGVKSPFEWQKLSSQRFFWLAVIVCNVFGVASLGTLIAIKDFRP